MRAYVTILDGDSALLPHFVRHYQSLGADLFPVTIYGTDAEMQDACKTIRALGGDPLSLGVHPAESFTARKREAFIRSMHHDGEWAFFCDLDEFACITANEVRQIVRSNLPYVAGEWVDRVAVGGKLVDVQAGIPIESQYPMEGRLRQEWGMGSHVYILAKHAPTSHHPNACMIGRRSWPRVPIGTVNHYKWQANVLPRLRKRLERIIAAGKSNSSWAHRVRRMIKHIEMHGGIDAQLLSKATSAQNSLKLC